MNQQPPMKYFPQIRVYFLRLFRILVGVAPLLLSIISQTSLAADMPAEIDPMAYSKSAAARGKSYFLINCQSCHDADGRALANIDFIAADLTAPDTWFYGDSPLHIFRSIKFGAGLEMPPFEGTIDNQTIWQIVAHILNIGPKATRPTEE